jgi:hypothetical protein
MFTSKYHRSKDNGISVSGISVSETTASEFLPAAQARGAGIQGLGRTKQETSVPGADRVMKKTFFDGARRPDVQ